MRSDEGEESDDGAEEVYNTESCFIDAIGLHVHNKIAQLSKHEHGEGWNISVMQHFDEAFDSVSMTRVWRRFLLSLYANPKRLPINGHMINDIVGDTEGYKSAVLEVVLKHAPADKKLHDGGLVGDDDDMASVQTDDTGKSDDDMASVQTDDTGKSDDDSDIESDKTNDSDNDSDQTSY